MTYPHSTVLWNKWWPLWLKLWCKSLNVTWWSFLRNSFPLSLKEVVLKNETDTFKAWENPPAHIYMQFYFFNVTNPLEVLSGDRPAVVEVGPYTYRWAEDSRKKNSGITIKRASLAKLKQHNEKVRNERKIVRRTEVTKWHRLVLTQAKDNWGRLLIWCSQEPQKQTDGQRETCGNYLPSLADQTRHHGKHKGSVNKQKSTDSGRYREIRSSK